MYRFICFMLLLVSINCAASEGIEPFGYKQLNPKAVVASSHNVILNDYLLKTGDEIIIDIWGDINAHYKLEIATDGFIDVPRTGRIYIQGLKFKDAKSKILKSLSQTYSVFINPDNPGTGSSIVDITLGKNFGVKLFVTGQVEKPGEINIEAASASIINALVMAGGVNSFGSLRDIRIKKIDNTSEHSFDYYNFLLYGQIAPEDKYLDDGDIIYVPMKGKSVTITGAVAKPGIYELKPDENLDTLIKIAGGFNVGAIRNNVKISRIENEKGESFLDIDLDKNKNEYLKDHDSIIISTIPEKKIKDIVSISGNGIRKPGMYEFRKGITAGILIDEAGGFYSDAYTDTIIITRTNPDLSKDIIKLNMKNSEMGKNRNLPLIPMDNITVYSEFEMKGEDKFVSISGAVKTPGKYLFNKYLTVQDILFMAGGFDDPDQSKKIYMERADIFRKKDQGEYEIIPFNIHDVITGRKNITLQSGDNLRIYSINEMIPKKQLEISGEVKNPGKYELSENMNIMDLVHIAGGLTEAANPGRISIGRTRTVNNNTIKEDIIKDLDKNDDKLFQMKENDLVIIQRNPFYDLNKAVVVISGEVCFPGTYNYISNEKVMSFIDRAGGFRKDVNIGRIKLVRDKIESEVYIKNAMNDRDDEQNFRLKPGDLIKVELIEPWIYLEGNALKNPGRLIYKSGEDYKYYLDMAGNIKSGYSPSQILIKTSDGDLYNARKTWWFNPEVPMNSTIIVN